MKRSLYRKYRPQTFDDVVGQDHVVRTLRNAVDSGTVAHAYLFAGPRGTGKTTTARILAKALNCVGTDAAPQTGRPSTPCGACRHCVAIAEGSSLDVIEIDGASNRGVDDVRDLRDTVAYRAGDGRFKVYIIDEVHMLSRAAFNALLKTLEEPPAHVSLRVRHDRAAQGPRDDPLALPALRLPAAAGTRHRPSAGDLQQRGIDA